MSRGPKLEQIEGGDPTFRVEAEWANGCRATIPGAELLTSEQAVSWARTHWAARKVDPSLIRVCVVNERTGFTRDEISRG